MTEKHVLNEDKSCSNNEPTITCPNCHHEMKLTESLAAPMIEQTRHQFDQRLALKDQEIQKREAFVREQLEAVEKSKAAVADEVAARLKLERERIATEEAKKARMALGSDLDQRVKEVAELQKIVADKDEKLGEAQKVQADLMKKQRELDDARRELEVTVEKKVQESLVSVRHKARQEAEEGLKLKVTEKEEQIASMQRQIEELRRKAEQGSQQLQGEAFEIELEAVLRSKFPRDIIEPVPKGEFGGDVLHRVVGPSGQICGTILWESKRTKNWSDTWLPKLREDQRTAKAELALIVSSSLPKGVETFDHVDGVWVTEPRCMVPVALALRQTLIELASARQASEGQQTKMELVYQYLTGPRFRHRIEAIVERFSDMQADLERERKATTRLWAKREEQIRGVIESTVGMYGDLQGIAGRALQEIESLDVFAIEAKSQEAF
ncbi:DUF2130 domain-containing protein [Aestuariivirga litoralis]|uniref:DUF2130 domain-containing protein n=1 Tax=Aestuariivirga litoralis TaxID=2650924 RepID=UPI0018C598F4|nr:DUF2130 domain-containing protein [Aestuariivirga litoralis]MBG1233987.1 DUF2130 domain-containing protein [Aestuariivirga litoralis]